MVRRAHLKVRDLFRLLKFHKRYREGNNEEPTSRVANELFSITFSRMKTIREHADRELRENNKNTGSSHLMMVQGNNFFFVFRIVQNQYA